MRPIVGITCLVERARWGVWDQDALVLPWSYIASVETAGGMPVALVPGEATALDPARALAGCHALILAGGADLHPGLASTDSPPGFVAPVRDRAELALLRHAIEVGIPVLGVCRGMQLLNLALGGTLIDDLPDALGHHDHLLTPGTFAATHPVRLVPGSRVARAVGAASLDVASHHHQGVAALGRGLVPTGWDSRDGLVEAVELDGHQWVVGVQWHPEADHPPALLQALVRAAAG